MFWNSKECKLTPVQGMGDDRDFKPQGLRNGPGRVRWPEVIFLQPPVNASKIGSLGYHDSYMYGDKCSKWATVQEYLSDELGSD